MENIIKNNIAVSILNAENKEEFLKKLKTVITKNKIGNISVHIDVMDGAFVNASGIDLKNAKIAKKEGFFVDVHLMVEKPIDYINKLVKYNADNITVHVEIDNIKETLDYLNELKKENKLKNIGLAIKPDTDVKEIKKYLNYIDMILIMTVEPGYGMQKYIEKMEEKMSFLKSSGKILQVDGGINNDTIIRAKKHNINSFVVGSYLTKHEEKLKERLDILNREIEG